MRSAPGLLIAEIQQASDTTYRLFDWNRVDRDGKPRPLHIEQALDTIDFSRGPVAPITAGADGEVGRRHDWWRATSSCSIAGSIDEPQRVRSDDRFHISRCCRRTTLRLRRATIACNCDAAIRFSSRRRSRTLKSTPQGRAVLLDMYLP